MVKVMDSARIKLAGKEIKGNSLDDTSYASQLVWESYHERARSGMQKYESGPHTLDDGRIGVAVRASMSSVIKSLWPELNQQDDETQERLRLAQARIGMYLRGYGNMLMIEKGYSGGRHGAYLASKWWVSNVYSEIRLPRSKVKVSAEEAGETRVPSEVTTRYKCRFCDGTYARRDVRNRHEKQKHGIIETGAVPHEPSDFVPAHKPQDIENGDIVPDSPELTPEPQTQTASDPVAMLQFILDDYKTTKARLEAIEKLLRGE